MSAAADAPSLQVTTLDNGVRVVTDRMPSLKTASLSVWFRAGTMDEKPEENGVAHLLEHMAFKGTATRSARDIAEHIENVGGQINAATSYQRTGYYARFMERDIDLCFDILADILNAPLLAPDEIEREKEVVIQEIGEAADTPDDVVMEDLQAVCFGDHAIARPILGTIKTVRAQTAHSLKRFTSELYTPERMVISAAGAIDPDRVLKLSNKYFGGRQAGSARDNLMMPRYVGGVKHDARKTEQTHLTLGMTGVDIRDPRFYAASVFSEAYGGGMSSRLFQTIREQEGLAYSVYSFVEGYYDVGLLCTYAGGDAEAMPRIAALMMQELRDMAASITDAELNRARELVKASVLMGLETPSARTDVAAAHLFAHGRIVPQEEMIDRLDAVTKDDLKEFARHALGDQVSVAIVGPCDFNAVLEEVGAAPSDS